jgi:hypothetical protein
MDETLVVDRISWCRDSARHRYVGTLWASADRIRLVGRDATFGIEVSLSIPLDEIEQIEIDISRREPAHGEPCMVLTLVESSPILVWRVGAADGTLAEVAAKLSAEREAAVGGPFALA